MARSIRWDILILVVILLGIFWIRMGMSATTPNLSYDSYLTVRGVEHILETGKPLSEDGLSLLSGTRIKSPVFEYFLAGLVWFTPEMYKIVPNIFMTLLLLPIFFLARRITKSTSGAIVSVLLAGSGQFIFASNLNTPSATPLAVLLLLTILAMLHDPNKNLTWIVLCTLLLTFLHPIVFILVLSLLVIIILLRLEGFGVDGKVNELFFFTLLLSLWYYTLIYKRAFFVGGMRILWKNLPTQYAAISYGDATFLTVLYGIGVITFLFGVLGAYHVLFELRAREAFGVVGATLAVLAVLFLKLVEFKLGMLILTTLLAIMAGYGLIISMRYILKTKTPWLVYPAGLLVLVLFLFSALLPTLTAAQQQILETPSPDDVAAFRSLQNLLPSDAVVMTTPREAWAVQYFSRRTTLMDMDFLLLNNAGEILRDVNATYTARFTTPVVNRADKWGVQYILFSNEAARNFDRDQIFVDDPVCLPFEQLSGEVKIYKVLCRGVGE